MIARYGAVWILPILSLLVSCGVTSKTKNARASVNSGLDGTEKAAVTLDVASTVKDALTTNAGRHQLSVALNANAALAATAPDFLGKLKTKVTITGPSGAQLPVAGADGTALDGGVQSAAKSDWQIVLVEKAGSSEGVYKITVEVIAPGEVDRSIIELPKPWQASVTLDVTAPVIGVKAGLVSSLDSGARSLTMHAYVTNKSKATCDSAELRTSDTGATLPLTLASVTDDAFLTSAGLPKGTLLFAVTDVAIADNLHDPFTVYTKCTDSAGNASEFILPVNASAPPFLFQAVAEGPTGLAPNSQDKVVFAKPGVLNVDLSLVDAKTAVKVSDLVASREQVLLRTIVTDAPVTALADLLDIKTPLYSQVYTPTLSFTMSSGYDGLKTIYVSMVLHDLNTNTDQLLGTVPLNLYVASVMPTVTWIAKPQFVPAVANATLTGQFIVTLPEAPLASMAPLALEYTSDGATWNALDGVTFTQLTTSGLPYQFSVPYPLTGDAPFRIRVKATDFAGNVAVSGIGPNLVGRSILSGLPIASTERTAAAGLSAFKPWLASATLCRKADGLGVQSGAYYVQLVLQNRGGAPLAFFSNGTLAAGMGYKVFLADPTTPDFQSRFEPPTGFMLAPTDTALFDFSMTDSWIAAPKVVIRFGLEPNGASSLTNPLGGPTAYQDVVVQDVASGLKLIKGAFACDQPGLMTP